MSSAEALAEKYEKGEDEVKVGSGGKRTKAEQVEHKHPHPEGDTRKIVSNAVHGNDKRKEKKSESK